jgi:hypothetical protein
LKGLEAAKAAKAAIADIDFLYKCGDPRTFIWESISKASQVRRNFYLLFL